jgi:drug/metabolite transporter (DMT)-like permease
VHKRATLIGFSAILMWALLALFTAGSGKVPPFQLAAMCFTIGGTIGLVALVREPARIGRLRQPPAVWLLGVGGLFGYHFFYFTALRNAPPVEAGLIAYLWPLLIVVGSAALPGERLRWYHIAGAMAGLCGTALIVAGDGGVSFEAQYALGYGAAFLGALTGSA